jgi:malonyl-CoA O-methyltransferase
MRIDKAQVAQRFARAHQSYKTHAVVQQQICQQLMAKMQRYIVQQKLSDQPQPCF